MDHFWRICIKPFDNRYIRTSPFESDICLVNYTVHLILKHSDVRYDEWSIVNRTASHIQVGTYSLLIPSVKMIDVQLTSRLRLHISTRFCYKVKRLEIQVKFKFYTNTFYLVFLALKTISVDTFIPPFFCLKIEIVKILLLVVSAVQISSTTRVA